MVYFEHSLIPIPLVIDANPLIDPNPLVDLNPRLDPNPRMDPKFRIQLVNREILHFMHEFD